MCVQWAAMFGTAKLQAPLSGTVHQKALPLIFPGTAPRPLLHLNSQLCQICLSTAAIIRLLTSVSTPPPRGLSNNSHLVTWQAARLSLHSCHESHPPISVLAAEPPLCLWHRRPLVTVWHPFHLHITCPPTACHRLPLGQQLCPMQGAQAQHWTTSKAGLSMRATLKN